MPNSRKRRRPRDRHPRRSGHPGRAGRREIDDRLRARAMAEYPILKATDDAEARGDARAALELMAQDLAQRADPNFWRPERMRRVLALSEFGPLLPRWATSRWILAQAAQHLDPRTRGRFHRAMDIAIETRGGVGTLVGVDERDARCKVMDHDWVFRQVWLYELGALEHFLNRIASPDLVAGADRITDWMRAPMGGFRLVGETPRSLTLLDLATGESRTALNIGSATLIEDGECAIGRLVPIYGGSMFETAPLWVPDTVAERVAETPHEWVAAVAEGCRATAAEGPRKLSTVVPEVEALTDVPRSLQALFLAEVADLTGAPLTPGVTMQEFTTATVALVRLAMEDRLPENTWGDKQWPMVGATLLDPGVVEELAARLGPADCSGLWDLSDRLVGPAEAICHELALDLEAAA